MAIQRSCDTVNVNEEYWEKGNTGMGEWKRAVKGKLENQRKFQSTQ
jgi:hypothetical protein